MPFLSRTQFPIQNAQIPDAGHRKDRHARMLAPQCRMQFQNTSDTAMRTEIDGQDHLGELHAKLVEDSQDGGNCTTRGADTPTTRRQRASCSAKPPITTSMETTARPTTPQPDKSRTQFDCVNIQQHPETLQFQRSQFNL